MTTQQRTYAEHATQTAQSYYNSSDADNFYYHVWGGEDIHIGWYNTPDEPIAPASRRTVEKMAKTASGLRQDWNVLDLGAGYGGSCRYLAKTYGCRCVALNLSEVENRRDREKNREQGLDERIDVVDASFEEVPAEDNTFDLVWSQDAFLHSGRRAEIVTEIRRVLKPGGQVVFTDPMRTDDCPDGVLDPILARLNLEDLACPAFYREQFSINGFEELGFDEHPELLVQHYQRVLDETVLRHERGELEGKVGDEYIERMQKGLRHWVNGGRNGYLTWGIFHFGTAR